MISSGLLAVISSEKHSLLPTIVFYKQFMIIGKIAM